MIRKLVITLAALAAFQLAILNVALVVIVVQAL